MQDDYTISRGILSSPESGPIAVRRIGKGAFATAYADDDDNVYVTVPEDIYDKEILADIHRDDPENPHLPAVEHLGYTRTGKVFAMPLYRMPLRKADTHDWQAYQILRRCWQEAQTAVYNRARAKGWNTIHMGHNVLAETVECAEQAGMSGPLLEAMEALRDGASNYGASYTFEISPRNVGSDEDGNLVLVDVLFDMEKLERMRAAKRRAAPQRRWNPDPGACLCPCHDDCDCDCDGYDDGRRRGAGMEGGLMQPDSFMLVFNTHKGLSYGLSYTGATLTEKLIEEHGIPQERLPDVAQFVLDSELGDWMGWRDILIIRVNDEESAKMYDAEQ